MAVEAAAFLHSLAKHLREGPRREEGWISFPPNTKDTLINFRGKDVLYELEAVEDIVSAADDAASTSDGVVSQDDCDVFIPRKWLDRHSRLDFCNILVRSVPCQAQWRGFALLAGSVFETFLDTPQSTYMRSLSKSEMESVLGPIISIFVDQSVANLTRRWAGTLALELMIRCDTNVWSITKGKRREWRQLGEVIIHGECQVLSLLAGSMIREIVYCDVALSHLWPSDFPRQLYAAFPRSKHHDIRWIDLFEKFVDELQASRILTRERSTVMLARSIFFGTEMYSIENAAAILLTVSMNITPASLVIIIPRNQNLPEKYIDIPLIHIQEALIGHKLSAESWNEGHYSLVLNLTHTLGTTYSLNAKVKDGLSITVAFSREDHAKDFQAYIVGEAAKLGHLIMTEEALDHPEYSGDEARSDPVDDLYDASPRNKALQVNETKASKATKVDEDEHSIDLVNEDVDEYNMAPSPEGPNKSNTTSLEKVEKSEVPRAKSANTVKKKSTNFAKPGAPASSLKRTGSVSFASNDNQPSAKQPAENVKSKATTSSRRAERAQETKKAKLVPTDSLPGGDQRMRRMQQLPAEEEDIWQQGLQPSISDNELSPAKERKTRRTKVAQKPIKRQKASSQVSSARAVKKQAEKSAVSRSRPARTAAVIGNRKRQDQEMLETEQNGDEGKPASEIAGPPDVLKKSVTKQGSKANKVGSDTANGEKPGSKSHKTQKPKASPFPSGSANGDTPAEHSSSTRRDINNVKTSSGTKKATARPLPSKEPTSPAREQEPLAPSSQTEEADQPVLGEEPFVSSPLTVQVNGRPKVDRNISVGSSDDNEEVAVIQSLQKTYSAQPKPKGYDPWAAKLAPLTNPKVNTVLPESRTDGNYKPKSTNFRTARDVYDNDASMPDAGGVRSGPDNLAKNEGPKQIELSARLKNPRLRVNETKPTSETHTKEDKGLHGLESKSHHSNSLGKSRDLPASGNEAITMTTSNARVTTPIASTNRAVVISFGPSGPKNQGVLSTGRSKTDHSHLLSSLSKPLPPESSKSEVQTNYALKRKLKDEEIELADKVESRKRQSTTRMALTVSYEEPPPSAQLPRLSQTHGRALTSHLQNTRVNENGSPMPSGGVNNADAADQSTTFENMDGIDLVMRDGEEEQPQPRLPPRRSGLMDTNPVFISSKNKQQPSSSSDPSSIGTVPRHRVNTGGAKQTIMPWKPQDSFQGRMREKANLQEKASPFMELLHKSNEVAAHHSAKATKDDGRSRGGVRKSIAFEDDPDKTLVEPISFLGPRKRKIVPDTESSSESASSSGSEPEEESDSNDEEDELAEGHGFHYRNVRKTLQEIAHSLSSHLTGKEKAANQLVEDYVHRGTAMIHRYMEECKAKIDLQLDATAQATLKLGTMYDQQLTELEDVGKQMSTRRSQDAEIEWRERQRLVQQDLATALAALGEP